MPAQAKRPSATAQLAYAGAVDSKWREMDDNCQALVFSPDEDGDQVGEPIPLPGECRGLYSGFGVVPEAVLRVPVFNRVSAFASVGGHYWRESSHVTHAAGVKVDIPKDRDSGFSFAAGAGADFALTNRMDLRLHWRRLSRGGHAGSRGVTLGLVYRP